MCNSTLKILNTLLRPIAGPTNNLLWPNAGPRDNLTRHTDGRSKLSFVSAMHLWCSLCYLCYLWNHLCLTKNAKFHFWEGNPGSERKENENPISQRHDIQFLTEECAWKKPDRFVKTLRKILVGSARYMEKNLAELARRLATLPWFCMIMMALTVSYQYFAKMLISIHIHLGKPVMIRYTGFI